LAITKPKGAKMKSSFVTDRQCNELADTLLASFEVGSLHSQSSTKAVAKVAQELLADDGLPTRWSLACVIAKKAQAAWQQQIIQTKS
jgi:hypothetical protein